MAAKIFDLKEEFIEKHKILEKVRCVLKTEFIGIDKIIDEVIDNVSYWYTLPDIQEKPIVINLWGLTGVGKTSLVIRLAELINFSDRFFRFDLGVKAGNFSFRSSLDDLCENNDSSPIIIALDEFQHSRTLSGPMREEVNDDKNRMIWELIDSGKVQYIDWKRGIWSFEDYIQTLNHLLNAGVKVRNGVVISGKDLYSKEMNERIEENEELMFISENKYDDIIQLAGEILGIYLHHDLRKHLLKLSGYDTIVFLNKVLKIGKRPSVKNFTKSLIFILGNLDEAYSMSGNFSTDIEADEFHKQSLKITIPQIKNALRRRFRDEQIARLGNIHIIYPALNRKAYLKIIKNELEKIAFNLSEMTELQIEFDKSIIELVYKEGVYPTQGVRPIFTSIHYLLKSNLSMFLSDILLKDIKPNKLKFTIQNKTLICSYHFEKSIIYEKQIAIKTTLEDMRKNKQDDMQAITAVHESGHAILSAILLRTIPEVIFSITSDGDNYGFVYSKFMCDYISRKDLIPRVAMFLGGYVAEEIIFGKEYLTTGASSDIEKATTFLSNMYKTGGMGKMPISYNSSKNDNYSYHQNDSVEEEVKQSIEQALDLAQTTLKKERKLLLAMSDYLCDNRMLKKQEIENLINANISNQMDFITNGELLFYRNHLKKAVGESKTQKSEMFHNAISLNKEK